MNKNVRLVVFDWAGTTVDFGCMAPAVVFKKVFEQKKINLSKEEILKPMGMEKKDHIRELLKLEHAAAEWKTENDVDEMYEICESMLSDIVAYYSVVIPGVKETVSWLKEEGTKIGSTTGYTREIMDRVLAKAAEGG